MKPLVLILAMSLALAGCATINGIGQDLSAGADRVSTWF
ncbi:entericidin EcnA/B family protein [Pseudaestuariivita sp.]